MSEPPWTLQQLVDQQQAREAELRNEVERLKAEVRRLRRLIGAAADQWSWRARPTPPGFGGADCPRVDGGCWWCGANLERASGPEPHETNCPWLELERENAAQREDEKA